MHKPKKKYGYNNAFQSLAFKWLSYWFYDKAQFAFLIHMDNEAISSYHI